MSAGCNMINDRQSVCEIRGRLIDIVYKNSSRSTLIFVEKDLMSMKILFCKEHAC